jgi:fucose permease
MLLKEIYHLKPNKNIFLIFTLFYIYFIIALFESSRGNFVPFFLEEFRINNAQMSLVLTFNTIGAIIGSFFAGHLCEKYGHKFVFFLGALISTGAVLIAPFASNIFLLVLFNFLFGAGRQLWAVSIDSVIPVLSVGFESILMNLTHFMYGLGSLTGQSLYGSLLEYGLHWRKIYLYLGVFFVASAVLTLLVKVPGITISVNREEKRRELFKNPLVYLFVGAVTFSFLGEAVIYTWFISYMRISYGFNPALAAKYAGVYYLLFALGRLAGGFILNKTGNVKGLKLYLLSGAFCILTGLLLRDKGLMIIAGSGFFVSVVFPTLMVVTNAVFKESASFAIGMITTLGNILFVVFFNITGVLNDLAGTYAAFFIAPASFIICYGIMAMIDKRTAKS